MNAAKQKFVIAKPMIGARTQLRDVTSRSPSRSSCANVLRGSRSCAGIRSFIRNQALARKLTESIAKTHPGAVNTIRMPATAGPKTFIALFVMPSSAFAGWSSPGADRLWHEAVRRRPEERRGGTEERSRDDEDRERHLVRQEHRRGERLEAGARAVAGEHHCSARQAIGDDAADEREGDARDPEGSEHRSEGVAEPLIERTAKARASGMRASPAADEARPSHSSRKGAPTRVRRLPPTSQAPP